MSPSARVRSSGWTRRWRSSSLWREALAVAADLLEADAADRVMDIIDREWGGLQILVNNVGGGGRWGKESVEDTDMRVWSEVYEKNAMAAVRFTRRALPHMRRGKWGRVVTITSIYGGKEGGGRPWFTMAKAAETGLDEVALGHDLPRARRHHLQFRGAGRHLHPRHRLRG